MPLGKLSKAQIAKGFEALEAIEDALSSGASRSRLADLSSAFYTIIPHSFGRNVPPVMDNAEMLQKKFDMLLVRIRVERDISNKIFHTLTMQFLSIAILTVYYRRHNFYMQTKCCRSLFVVLSSFLPSVQVLGDIELAQGLEREREKKQQVYSLSLPFPLLCTM